MPPSVASVASRIGPRHDLALRLLVPDEEFFLRLFVSEFICGGGWKAGECPASLIREGAAMSRALVEDLLQIPEMSVVTTWDRRLPMRLGIKPSPSLDIVPIAGPDEEHEVFRQLCEDSDVSYIIAPELNDELSRRTQVAFFSENGRTRLQHNPHSKNLNCSIEAIDLCGDKWALFEHLIRHEIPTIPTLRLVNRSDCDSMSWPRVLKLRLGAGSQSMQLVPSPDEWETAIQNFDNSSRHCEAIVQPYIPGQALSVGVIIDRSGAVHQLPIVDQFIDPDRGFVYLGGRVPSSYWTGSIDELLSRTLSMIPGLYGYVGIDLLIPDEAPDRPLIVEINPRLTTSYTGYRQLCRDNLAALWLGESGSVEKLRWRDGHVEFNSVGECS